MCVCVCVDGSERARKRVRENEREIKGQSDKNLCYSEAGRIVSDFEGRAVLQI